MAPVEMTRRDWSVARLRAEAFDPVKAAEHPLCGAGKAPMVDRVEAAAPMPAPRSRPSAPISMRGRRPRARLPYFRNSSCCGCPEASCFK